MRAGKKIVFAILICLIFWCVLIYIRPEPLSVEQPKAQQGYLDLAGWNFDRDGNVKLDGDWEFYWDRLLTPADFALPVQDIFSSGGYMKVPSAWKSPSGIVRPSDKGVATYRLRVKLDSTSIMYGLKTTSIRMANKIYVDGVEVGKSGNPAVSYEAGYIMANTPYVTTFVPQSNEVEIIVQVADFDYEAGGIVQSIYLGKRADIFAMAERTNFFSGFVASTLLITGVYFLFIYIGKRKDSSVLYFGASNILFALAMLAYGEKIILQIFPQLSAVMILKIQNVLLYGATILTCFFANEVTGKRLPRWFIPFVTTSLGGYMIVILIVPLSISTSVADVFLILAMTAYIIITFYFILAIIKKQYGILKRIEAIQLLVAFICILIFSTDGIFYVSNITNNKYVGYIAILVFIATISLMLSQQYKNAYNTIEGMSTKLLALDKLKDDFLANTSHELRTPLNGIINITNSVLDRDNGELTPLQRENLQVVVAAGRRLYNLINDILDISSLKNGEIRLLQRSVDMRSVVELVIYILSRLKEDKEIEFKNSIPEGMPPVYADVERLRQIFYNLVGNALKFTQKGMIEVGAEVRQDKAEIWVEDTGCGIPQDQQEDIYKAFYQVNAEETRETGGTGLGLSITKTLIELHGGSIRLDSEEGRGSRFTFSLPLCKVDEGPIHVESITDVPEPEFAEPPQLTSSRKNGERRYAILAADDDPASLTAIFNILDSEGYYVKAVSSGEAVLKELEKQNTYNLVILDVAMPKMSGYEVLQKIRYRFQPTDIPVLLLTAKARPEDLQAGFEAGANDYIPKPFETLELKARVKTLVQLKELVGRTIASELSFLQAQIKPHFLYNSLSVIAALSIREPHRAKELLYDLSDYLRGSFNFENYDGVTALSSELSTVRAYLSIEKERFKDKLNMEYDIDENVDVYVPMLTIQPLVENAIRHGILRKTGGGTVRLSIKENSEGVVITVQDNGIGIPPDKLSELLHDKAPGTGVGLRNIQRRLILHYGQGLEIQSVEGQGTTVTIKILQR